MVLFAAINIAFGLDFITGVTASIASIGNVGPGFGDVGSMSNYADFPAILKCTGMAEMLIGRLEIFPVLYLVQSIRGVENFSRSRKHIHQKPVVQTMYN